jgi:hypothetical protein
VSPAPGSSGRALVVLVLLLLVACGDDEGTPTAAGSTTASSPSTTASASTAVTSANPHTTPTTVDPTESMVASIAAGIREQAGIVTEAEADCAGRELVASVGIGRLQEVGRAAADQHGANPLELLTVEEQQAALARMQACINPASLEQLAPDGE